MRDGEELQRLRTAIAAAGDAAYDWDLGSDRIAWWGAAGAVVGPDGNPPPYGDAFRGLVHAADVTKRDKALADHLAGSGAFDCEYRLAALEGPTQWIHERGAVVGENGTRRLCGTLRNITQRKRAESQLEYLARYDELTGHFNRSRLKEALDHALSYAQRYHTPGAYMVVGIDRLAAVNEAFGHAAADAVIVGVGQRLDRCLRASDVIGRLDGDRFGVVLAPCPEGDMHSAAERILRAVSQSAIDTPNGPIHVTVSVGGVPFLDQWPSAHEAMTRADSALQQAKGGGRNCFVPFDDSPETREERRRALSIGEEVQAALKNGRLVTAVQPVVAAGTREVDHYECLLRLKREDGSLMAAGAFIPVVERTSLMRAIDRRALELAIAELHAVPHVKLAINISGLTAVDRGWLRMLSALLRGKPELAQRLIVEITETVALQDIEETAHFVSVVRELGCNVALDDFGAGYTSFRYLKVLAISCVKIDGSFVRGLTDNIDNQLFIRTLLGLADGFGLSTVAECVETAAEAALLERRGVQFLQGYHFGAPTIERPWDASTGQTRLVMPRAAAVQLAE
jgi:diguanylate cyclase (GGDEF)-like protein